MKKKRVKVGRFEVETVPYGVRVYDNGFCEGRIDGVSASTLTEEDIEEYLYEDIDEEDVFGNYGEMSAAIHDLFVEDNFILN